jgi:predicted DNA-binding protein
MKISEIQSSPKAELNAKATVIVSGEAKKHLELIAKVKGRTVSEVVREIIDNFLANNSDELAKLNDKSA